jgi:hypothetical protein
MPTRLPSPTAPAGEGCSESHRARRADVGRSCLVCGCGRRAARMSAELTTFIVDVSIRIADGNDVFISSEL